MRGTSESAVLYGCEPFLIYAMLRQQYTLIISSLEGDLRQDLRKGFATRSISPAELASMNSTDLASEERLKEMKQYEKEALKSLVRIDDAIPVKPLASAGTEIDGGIESAVVIAETIDVDSVVDLEEPRDARRHATGSQSIFLNGSAQSNVLEQTITSSGSAYFPLYPMSPGGGDGPSGLGHTGSTEGLLQRLSPMDFVDKNDTAYYSAHKEYPLVGGGPTPGQALPASGGSEDKEHFESLISRYYDREGGDPGTAQTGHSGVERETAAEGMEGKRIVWRGEVSRISLATAGPLIPTNLTDLQSCRRSTSKCQSGRATGRRPRLQLISRRLGPAQSEPTDHACWKGAYAGIDRLPGKESIDQRAGIDHCGFLFGRR